MSEDFILVISYVVCVFVFCYLLYLARDRGSEVNARPVPRVSKSKDVARPSWDETWMNLAREMACRSYDPRLKVGACIVAADNTSVLSVGYNGNYKGGPHEHESSEPGMSGFLHAEVNCVVKADFNFHKKKRMYITHSPCRSCAKLLINAEIDSVVYECEYRDTSGIELLREAGIKVTRYGT